MRPPRLRGRRAVFALLCSVGLIVAAPGVTARGITEIDDQSEQAVEHSDDAQSPEAAEAADDDAPAGNAEPEPLAEDVPPEEGPPDPDQDVDPADGIDPDPEVDIDIEPDVDPDAEPEVEPDIIDADESEPTEPDAEEPEPDADDPEPVDEDVLPAIDVEQLILELERAPIVFDRPSDARSLAVRIEADRRLLAELRKQIPTERTEAELYLRRIRDLAAISDPVSLVPLANNVIRQAPLLFEWMETEYDDPEARARDYYVGGSWAFHRRFDTFHRAVLLTVIRRLDTVGDLLRQGDQ
jgi:hypothetical protein